MINQIRNFRPDSDIEPIKFQKDAQIACNKSKHIKRNLYIVFIVSICIYQQLMKIGLHNSQTPFQSFENSRIK